MIKAYIPYLAIVFIMIVVNIATFRLFLGKFTETKLLILVAHVFIFVALGTIWMSFEEDVLKHKELEAQYEELEEKHSSMRLEYLSCILERGGVKPVTKHACYAEGHEAGLDEGIDLGISIMEGSSVIQEEFNKVFGEDGK